MKTYTPHPFANIFPMMIGEQYKSLSDSIAENGLRDPILLFKGQILDGRNRYDACTKRRVNSRFIQFQGTDEEAKKFVFDVNYNRRHLTRDQLACCAIEYHQSVKMTSVEKQALSTKVQMGLVKNVPVSQDRRKSNIMKTSDLFKVGIGLTTRANTLFLNSNDNFFTKVKQGEISLNFAYKEHRKNTVLKRFRKESKKQNIPISIKIPDCSASTFEVFKFINEMTYNGWIMEMKITSGGFDILGSPTSNYLVNWYGHGTLPCHLNWSNVTGDTEFRRAVITAAVQKVNK